MRNQISVKYVVGTGMLFAFILIILGLIYDKTILFKMSAIFLLLDMTIPKIFTSIAIIMAKLTEVLGSVVSRVILTLIWFLVITPVALIRRCFHLNTMLYPSSTNKKESVFVVRSGILDRSDLSVPY